ncbi:MAG: glycosyl transferase family 4 [Betaproteobacteria bacterium]|nr:glycosyl transferase family 4 [Betaproteobacteria bacterium]
MDEGLTQYIVAPIVSACATWGFLRILESRHNVPLDRPNERSLHAEPVPRVGGLAIVPAIAAGWAFVPSAVHWAICLPAVFLFAISFFDDVGGLRVPFRLAAHLLAAGIVAAALLQPQAGVTAALAATIAIAWMTNLYNFMDGADGLAGGMAFIGFGSYGIAAWIGGSPSLASACLAIALACLVFLSRNFHPARVFLGDSGSIPIGFLSAALGVQGWLENLWPAWFPLLVFSPFVVDASVTLLRRCARRERVWRAHRDHYYQRLVRLGWGHKKTAIAEYVLMLSCGLLALFALKQPAAAQGTLLAACALLYLLLTAFIDRAWRRHAPET